ncbi:putative reverse transcriptase domain-containing protein [Tanacetum coccineum]
MTRSAGRPVAASRGGGWVDKPIEVVGSEVNDGANEVPDFSTIIAQQLQNLLPTIVAQVGNQGRGQGNGKNQNDDAIINNIRSDYGTHVVELSNPHMRSKGRCRASHAAYTDRFHELARLVPHLVTPEATYPMTIQKAVKIASTLTDQALRNVSIKKNPEKRGNGWEPCKDRNVRDDNKRNRTGNAFATTTNPVRRENTDTVPKCTICKTHHLPGAPCRTCFNYNRPGHFSKDCRDVPKNVNPVNARNPTARACYGCGSQGRGNQENQARGRVFMLGAEEARQDPNIVTCTFTQKDHYATILFDSGVDYSFISTTFIPLLDIEPSDLGFSYEIKIASKQLVKIDIVIRGSKLEIEGHVFDINLIPFRSGSFDMIIVMYWLFDQKARIICHEKVVRIPLLHAKVLRVLGEKPKEKMRQLMSAKAKEKK